MKIVICASMSAAKKTMEVAGCLTSKNHQLELPRNIEKYATGKKVQNSSESISAKIDNDLIRDYYRKISVSDAVLVVNQEKNDIKNYIGGNSFLEMGYAYAMNKKIYLLNPIPDMIYTDELKVFDPMILNGNLEKIK